MALEKYKDNYKEKLETAKIKNKECPLNNKLQEKRHILFIFLIVVLPGWQYFK